MLVGGTAATLAAVDGAWAAAVDATAAEAGGTVTEGAVAAAGSGAATAAADEDEDEAAAEAATGDAPPTLAAAANDVTGGRANRSFSRNAAARARASIAAVFGRCQTQSNHGREK